MRVRILKRPGQAYGVDGESLRVGRVYNLNAALASALMADGCAELFDALPQDQKFATSPRDLWQAADRRAVRTATRHAPSTNADI